jgi:two-component system phosphate regulon response regulator PhoB
MDEHILLVEDDVAIAEMVSDALLRNGFECMHAADATRAQQLLAQSVPSLILLDWMLPGISGVEFARRLRRDERTRQVPIIMLTARGEEADVVTGFDAGVDDYVGKPFSIRELISRIRAVRRRSQTNVDAQVLEAGGLCLDPVSHRVSADEEVVKLGPTEFRLLKFFMENHDRVFSRGQLLSNVWGSNVYVEERTVDVHIRRLRKALGSSGYDAFVQTVHGAGYRFSRQI